MSEFTRANQFPNTRWTMVARSADTDDATRENALGELCELYWPPVYAFIRSKGNSPHDAEDLAQGFFASLLAREDIAKTDASKGKLRSLLLASVKNFMANEWWKASHPPFTPSAPVQMRLQSPPAKSKFLPAQLHRVASKVMRGPSAADDDGTPDPMLNSKNVTTW